MSIRSRAILSVRNRASLRASVYVIALAETTVVIIITIMSINFFIVVLFYMFNMKFCFLVAK